MARSLADIKKTHGPRDYASEMRVALKGIKAGEYESSGELCQRASIPTKAIPTLLPLFDAHSIQIKNNANKPAFLWARTPADAKKLRDALKSQNG